jgi:hypothetical protein
VIERAAAQPAKLSAMLLRHGKMLGDLSLSLAQLGWHQDMQ